MRFPVYRKYANGKSYFIITSDKTWTEYKQVGKRFEKHEFTATQYPEMLFIQDLLKKNEGVLESNAFEISQLSLAD
ncbi:MAG TPA: hypothetical protein VD905_16905 [Flavobacteriales bacterium]|nr:hypothetical protein [Flavobacteriales bacterium]